MKILKRSQTHFPKNVDKSFNKFHNKLLSVPTEKEIFTTIITILQQMSAVRISHDFYCFLLLKKYTGYFINLSLFIVLILPRHGRNTKYRSAQTKRLQNPEIQSVTDF